MPSSSAAAAGSRAAAISVARAAARGKFPLTPLQVAALAAGAAYTVARGLSNANISRAWNVPAPVGFTKVQDCNPTRGDPLTFVTGDAGIRFGYPNGNCTINQSNPVGTLQPSPPGVVDQYAAYWVSTTRVSVNRFATTSIYRRPAAFVLPRAVPQAEEYPIVGRLVPGWVVPALDAKPVAEPVDRRPLPFMAIPRLGVSPWPQGRDRLYDPPIPGLGVLPPTVEVTISRPGAGVRPSVRSIPSIRGVTRAIPISPKTEAKVKLPPQVYAVFRAMGYVSEVNDLIEALYEAIPRHIRARCGAHRSINAKYACVFTNLHEINIPQAVINVAYNVLEDAAVGGQFAVNDRIFDYLDNSGGLRRLLSSSGGLKPFVPDQPTLDSPIDVSARGVYEGSSRFIQSRMK